MKLLILSDIHGNKTALETVFSYIRNLKLDSVALLGDLIDYGPHSNDVVEMVASLKIPIVCNIFGNHEDAIINDNYGLFSSQRGIDCAKNTKALLTEHSKNYILTEMTKNGKSEFSIDEKKFLAVHGTINDIYWGKFDCSNDLSPYSSYDVVLMGHSHRPIFFEKFFTSENVNTRNQKKTIFINPGSVGQPRNINPYSQFVIFDTNTENCEFIKLKYNYAEEQKSFTSNVDEFYKTRLKFGV